MCLQCGLSVYILLYVMLAASFVPFLLVLNSLDFVICHEKIMKTTTKIHYSYHSQREKTLGHLVPNADGTYKRCIKFTKHTGKREKNKHNNIN